MHRQIINAVAEALGWNADWSSNTWLEAGRPL